MWTAFLKYWVFYIYIEQYIENFQQELKLFVKKCISFNIKIYWAVTRPPRSKYVHDFAFFSNQQNIGGYVLGQKIFCEKSI